MDDAIRIARESLVEEDDDPILVKPDQSGP